MTRGFTLSSAMHAFICLLLIFGLPNLFFPDKDIAPQPKVMIVDVVDIKDITNLPPMSRPKKEQPKPKKPEPPKPESKKPEVEKETVKHEKPRLAPPAPPKKPKPPTKPVVKKEEPKKEEEPKKQEEEEPSLEDVLASVSQTVDETRNQNDSAPSDTKSSSNNFDPYMPISATVEAAIRGQITRCWKYFGGGKDEDNVSITIQIEYNLDGTVKGVKVPLEQNIKIKSSDTHRKLYNSARNAVLDNQCDPLKGLPQDEYNSWKKVEFTFAPQGLI